MSKSILTERLAYALNSLEPVKEEVPKNGLSPDEVRFKSLLIAMRNKTVSFRQAVVIVGGTVRLTRLIEEGRVRCDKLAGSQNRKWRINAADCYNNVRPRIKDINRSMAAC